MFLVKDWLLEFVSLPPTATDEEIARRLSLSTVEVEGVHTTGEKQWDHIVVGEIVSVDPHPNADRLRIAMVNLGDAEPKTIVCGGSNMAVGMKVAVALPGAQVRWHGEGEPITLEKTTIRGIASDGMICASAEIGLSDMFPPREEKEILDLSSLDARAGTSLNRALPMSTVFEIDNKSLSHRPDLWGHRGIARELAALFSVSFHDKKLPNLPSGTGHALTISIADSDLCSRYVGLVVDGVSYTPSPSWMQERLRAAGIRPITALVDITNYVMLEYGQPMHAFDFDAIAGKKGAHIIVRRANGEETIRTLDGIECSLSSDTLIVANTSRPLAIAGVMGGEDSRVSESTKTVVFEAAHFAPLSIRRTATKLGLISESSRRFEKDLDPELPPHAMARVLQLCAAIFPHCRVSSPVRDVYRARPRAKSLLITREDIERRLGVTIPLGRAATILKRLGFPVRAGKQSLSVDIPSFRRKDVAIPEDVLEEVLRVVGYESVPSNLPRLSLRAPQRDGVRVASRAIKEHLTNAFAFREVMTYAFSRPAIIRACGLSLDDHLELANPLSQERPFLCRSLVPNLLEVLEKNQQKEKRHAFFEVNRVFLKGAMEPNFPSDQTLPVPSQPLQCAFVYLPREDADPFVFCADMLRTLLRSLGWIGTIEGTSMLPFFSRNRSALLRVGGQDIGYLGEISQKTAENIGISGRVIACEFNLTLLASLPPSPLHYREEGSFPAVLRDVTFVVDESCPYGTIAQTLSGAHPLIEHIEPFAMFRNTKIGGGKKNISFHVIYRSLERTLTSDEVEDVHTTVVKAIHKQFGATVR